MAIETERKYLHVDLKSLRLALQDLGFTSSGAYFESNTLFDTSGLELAKTDQLLRLRKRQWRDRSDFVLTFKGPGLTGIKTAKSREELELGINNPQIMAAIFAKLGYIPSCVYEKMRESWHNPEAYPHCGVDLDTLPFGDYVELEAPYELIDGLAERLGLSKYGYNLLTYYDLHQDWRKLNNLPFETSFVFNAKEKNSILSELGHSQ